MLCLRQVLAIALLAYLIFLMYLPKSKQGYLQTYKQSRTRVYLKKEIYFA